MVRVIFIGGLGRSGTTLLERILGELPDVTPLGEVVHLWHRDLYDDERCGCGQRFSACPFWQAVGTRAFGGWSAVDGVRILALRDAVEHRPAPAELVAEYAGYYARLYRAAAEISGAAAVVDSSRQAALAYCLSRSIELDLRVVHMVRRTGGAPSRPWTAPGAATTADRAAFGLLRRRGVPVRRVRYEDLVADPVRTVRSIADFAGLPDPGSMDFLTDHAVSLHSCHSVAGNPMRFATGELPLGRDPSRPASANRPRRLVNALSSPLLNLYPNRRR